jgi:hypothetical protein
MISKVKNIKNNKKKIKKNIAFDIKLISFKISRNSLNTNLNLILNLSANHSKRNKFKKKKTNNNYNLLHNNNHLSNLKRSVIKKTKQCNKTYKLKNPTKPHMIAFIWILNKAKTKTFFLQLFLQNKNNKKTY